MNSYQISKHRCFNMVVTEAEQHQATIAQVAKFVAGVVRLKAISAELDELKVLQEQDITGVTVDKDNIKELLVPLLGDLASALQAHALETKNQTLFEKVNYSENALDLLAKDKLDTVSTIIVTEAEKVSAENLAEFGILATELSEIKELHTSYKLALHSPQHASIERSNYTEKIAKLIDEGWGIMKNTLDKLIGQFRRKDPEFYMKYMAASHVAYPHRRRNGNDSEENSGEDKTIQK